jgi:hypothetical protein
MEQFLVLTTTTEQNLANKTCAALENAGIPVMLEHIEIVEGEDRASGYRVLVPSQFTATAMRLVKAASTAFYSPGSSTVH